MDSPLILEIKNDNKLYSEENNNKNNANNINKKSNFIQENTKGNELINKEIICSECKENCFININDYKIKLFGCKNGHNINNIPLKKIKIHKKYLY